MIKNCLCTLHEFELIQVNPDRDISHLYTEKSQRYITVSKRNE